MSHTIGQAKKDNQPSNAERDLSSSEEKTSQSGSQLSDADYEFLFSQLLEGVAHGWHDRRIIKFFQQLGDRGKPEDWVAWLERKRSKLILLPIQSKRQLGTVMIRLGEITQSAPEVREIGTASNRIGRELLFGNIEDLVWEYVGPDLIVETLGIELETEEKLSSRLPEDFTELGSATIAEAEIDLSLAETLPEESKLPESSEENLSEIDTISVKEDFSLSEMWEESPEIATNETDFSAETVPPATDLEVSEIISASLELAAAENGELTDDSEALNTHSKDFEFELEEESELATEELIQVKEETEIEELSGFTTESEQSQSIDFQNSQSSEIVEPTELETEEPTAIDIDKLLELIQEDDRLVQEISEKLNIIPAKPENSNNSSLAAPIDLDSSSVDLIEGWFNLGLKQVSGGEFDKAIASWEKALKINPNLSEAWHNRGSALGRLGKYQEAVASFQKALEIDPDNYQAWNDRAHALYQMQNWLAAAESWNNALKLTPGNHLFWYNRGCALEQLENWTESISSYEKSLEIKPDFQPARARYTNLVADNSRSN